MKAADCKFWRDDGDGYVNMWGFQEGSCPHCGTLDDRDECKHPEYSTTPEEETKEEIEKIYENEFDSTALPTLVIDVNRELKSYLAKYPHKLYDLSPRKFEELVAEILSDFGFDVNLTTSTRDGGKDILAYMRNQISSYLMFVECKKWKPEHHVGIEVVQRLYGVQQVNNANKSMIVTTSFFSKPAIVESKRYEYLMDLKDYNDLTSRLKQYL